MASLLFNEMMIRLHLRFYEELNDFLPYEKRKVTFIHSVSPNTSIKDVIEALGVPHTEIDLILVNQKSVDFNYRVRAEDYISIYPMFEALDISNVIKLRPIPLRHTRFILDVHLGKLAKHLRLLGFDVVYATDFSDETIADRSQEEKRITLTRDVGLLKNKKITHGYWVRQTNPEKQVEEVLKHFDLYTQCHPFTRCIECNGLLKATPKENVRQHIPPQSFEFYQTFMRCEGCQRIYWEGTHYQKLKNLVDKFLSNNKDKL